jgi:hypothetical protein
MSKFVNNFSSSSSYDIQKTPSEKLRVIVMMMMMMMMMMMVMLMIDLFKKKKNFVVQNPIFFLDEITSTKVQLVVHDSRKWNQCRILSCST